MPKGKGKPSLEKRMKRGTRNAMVKNIQKEIKQVVKLKAGRTPLRAGRVRGRGDYLYDNAVTPALNWLRERPEGQTASRFNKIASGLAGAVGDQFGVGDIARTAASTLSRWFGMGNYTKRSNSLASVPPPSGLTGTPCTAQGVAQFKSCGSVTMAHREYIRDITANDGAAFTPFSIFLNPGNPQLCPWLSQIAPNFEEYEWLGLIFEYRSSSGNIVASSPGMGLVIMATDYDVVDAPFTTKQEMEITDFAVSNPCYVDFDHAIECSPRQNVQRMMYVQPGITSAASCPDDPRFSSLGNFQLALTGIPGTSNIGELWVTYHIRLSKPVLGNSVLGSGSNAHAMYTIPQSLSTPRTAFTVHNNGGVQWDFSSGNALTTQTPGTYLVSYTVVCNSGTAVPSSSQTLVGTATFQEIGTNSNGTFDDLTNNLVAQSNSGLFAVASVIINIVNPGDGLIPYDFYSTSDPTYVDFYVAPYYSGITKGRGKSWSLAKMMERLARLESKEERRTEHDDGEATSSRATPGRYIKVDSESECVLTPFPTKSGVPASRSSSKK